MDEHETTAPKKRTRRHVKCTCAECGYADTVCTSRKWLDLAGRPRSPVYDAMAIYNADEAGSPERNQKTPKFVTLQLYNCTARPSCGASFFAQIAVACIRASTILTP
ncbi:hypothetical protein [Burkholderia sp. WP9]|uniref:hypothetical protein n=1 Tax=Burkholderia sp. WP9 TaxID=1500263 RepID=UPI00115FAB0A|nr:hypothetical protein [Burkholderia sp. WP9]